MFVRTMMCMYLVFNSIIAMADDFRGLSWGASLSQVKKAEKAKFVNGDADTLYFEGSISGVSIGIWYFFLNGHLVEATYNNQESHINKNDYILDFQNVNKLLKKKYGTPILDEQIWDGEYYKDKPSQWGGAIGAGQLKYVAKWETDRTTISSGLVGDNFRIIHHIIYREKASKLKMNSIKEKEALEQL